MGLRPKKDLCNSKWDRYYCELEPWHDEVRHESLGASWGDENEEKDNKYQLASMIASSMKSEDQTVTSFKEESIVYEVIPMVDLPPGRIIE